MYALGHKYQISGLKALAQRKFQKAALQHWNSEEFALALHIIYTSTLEEDRCLQDVVISTISRDRLLKKPEIRAAVKGILELAFGLLMYCQTGYMLNCLFILSDGEMYTFLYP